MQLKKNPRDPQYADATDKFEDDSATNPETFEMPTDQNLRTRTRTPEMDADAASTPARVASSGRTESLVDAHSNFDGRYETEHDLRIQGTISGEIVCSGLLTVDQEATARAKIQTRDAHIRGRVEGDIICSGKLLLAATSIVSGTLKAATLVVEEGATLVGSVETSASPAPSRSTATPAAPAGRQVASLDEERQGRRATEPVAAAATTPPRSNGRQAPSFAFVPSDDRRPDRN
jgi:cytoskeletal protein CcmA (bactofilin family)